MPTPRLTLRQRIARRLRWAAKFLIPKTQQLVQRRSVAARQTEAGVRRRGAKLVAGWLPAGLLTTLAAAQSFADPIYVDSRRGNDQLDGFTQEQVSARSGPVRTLHRAVQLVSPGDQIILANNGAPYLGGLSLYGLQQSGTPSFPVEIIGNGCVVTGAKPIVPTTWKQVGADIWRITPCRKGWYQLVMDGETVTEVPCPPDAPTRPELPASSWCAFQGAIYFHPPAGAEAPALDMALADEQTGLSLVAVEYVVVRDLTVRHFRQDGIHLFDRCRGVVLDNVTCEGNGRAGIVVGGTSSANLVRVTCQNNRQESLLVEQFGVVEASESTFDAEPTVLTLE